MKQGIKNCILICCNNFVPVSLNVQYQVPRAKQTDPSFLSSLMLSVIVHVAHFSAHTGLLNDVDSDYYVQPSPERNQPQLTGYQRAEMPYNRSNLTLEDELDHRFGESTLPSIRSEYDDRRRDKMTIPPRGLFDDV